MFDNYLSAGRKGGLHSEPIRGLPLVVRLQEEVRPQDNCQEEVETVPRPGVLFVAM